MCPTQQMSEVPLLLSDQQQIREHESVPMCGLVTIPVRHFSIQGKPIPPQPRQNLQVSRIITKHGTMQTTSLHVQMGLLLDKTLHRR